MFRKLWNDDAGVVSLEYLMLSTVVGLGMAVGTSAVSDALNVEYIELSNAILALSQAYSVNNQAVNGAFFFGSIGTKSGTVVTEVGATETYYNPGVFFFSPGSAVLNTTP